PRSRASFSRTGGRYARSGSARLLLARGPASASWWRRGVACRLSTARGCRVSLVYRKGWPDSPPYRLNHEEIIEFFEESVRFVEKLSPLACVPDARGALSGVEFETATGDKVTLPARTLFVAAGTSPNVTYERERPGSFAIDPRTKGFQAFRAVHDDGKLRLGTATS